MNSHLALGVKSLPVYPVSFPSDDINCFKQVTKERCITLLLYKRRRPFLLYSRDIDILYLDQAINK